MADEIYLKTGNLSSALLRKAIRKAENAQKKGYAAIDEVCMGHYWSWGGNNYRLYSTNAESLICDAGARISSIKTKLEKLATILNSGPESMEEIDRKYRSDLKDWQKSENHDEILWAAGGGAATAKETEVINSKKTSGVSLVPNMGNYSMRQRDYSEFTYPYGYNAGCCATAYAIGLSIVTGEAYDPTEFWHDGEWGYQTYYDAGHKSGWTDYNPDSIYQNLLEGKPTELAYIYPESPAAQTDADHFVLITGIREGADPDNLAYEDFVVIDPVYGDERPLTDSWKFNPERVTGGFVIQ